MILFNLTGKKVLISIAMLGVVVGAMAQSFELKCNGAEIKVFEQNDVPFSYDVSTYKYARVTYNGNPLELEVTAFGFEFDNKDWDISPHSYGIKGKKKGNTISFNINRKGYMLVRFKKNQEFTKRLVIFVEAPEEFPDGELVDIVKTYQVDNTGKQNETQKIQQSLNDISGSGKILYFPEGLYKTFSLKIKSNSKIHLAKNARIKADRSEIDSYLAKGNKGINRFIFIDNAENIEVSGLGTLDANGSEFLAMNPHEMAEKSKNIRLLFLFKSKNVSFDGIVLKDAASWNTHIMGCQDIFFKRCKLLNTTINNEYFGSLDGWDPDASKRVLIENCFGWAGDDNVAVKCTGYGNLEVYDDVEDITVRGCVFLTKKTSLKIGTETRCESYKCIVFEDNDIIEADRVLGVNVRDRAIVDGVLFKNIRSEFNYPDRKQMLINAYIARREDDQPWTGKLKNVRFENCSFEQNFPKKIQLNRIESHTQKDDLQVTFKNLTIANKEVKTLTSEFFNLNKCNGVIKFNE